MKRITLITLFLLASFASARLVQRPIMNSKGKDVWQVDAKYTQETYNGFNGFGSLHGNAIYEYQYKNREREFLVLTVDPTNSAICYGIAQIKDGKRVPKEGWSRHNHDGHYQELADTVNYKP